MKTILAPNAPWPKPEEWAEKPKPKPKGKPRPKTPPKTKIAQTNVNFERWLERDKTVVIKRGKKNEGM